MNLGALEDLAMAGYPVASISQLRNSGTRYAAAIPILLDWLSKAGSAGEKEEIVRALSVPWAKSLALRPLIDEFSFEPVPSDARGELLRWAVGNALEVLWDDREFDRLEALARDVRFGGARQMVVLGFGKSKRPEAVDLLLQLLDDPDVDGHAVKALGRLRARAARSALEARLDDKRAWVRAEARRALARMS
jgi:hypothetical protein